MMFPGSGDLCKKEGGENESTCLVLPYLEFYLASAYRYTSTCPALQITAKTSRDK